MRYYELSLYVNGSNVASMVSREDIAYWAPRLFSLPYVLIGTEGTLLYAYPTAAVTWIASEAVEYDDVSDAELDFWEAM